MSLRDIRKRIHARSQLCSTYFRCLLGSSSFMKQALIHKAVGVVLLRGSLLYYFTGIANYLRRSSPQRSIESLFSLKAPACFAQKVTSTIAPLPWDPYTFRHDLASAAAPSCTLHRRCGRWCLLAEAPVAADDYLRFRR